VLFAGDLIFKGRIPFVGDADSRLWLNALDKLIALQPKVLVPATAAPRTTHRDLVLTRDYSSTCASRWAARWQSAVFRRGYATTDWSMYEQMPAFREAHRRNAYNTTS